MDILANPNGSTIKLRLIALSRILQLVFGVSKAYRYTLQAFVQLRLLENCVT